MIDFLMISTRSTKRGVIEIYPKFRLYPKSSDLMIRGGDFYAIWDEENGRWSTDEAEALMLIDRELDRYAEENRHKFDSNVKILHMWDSESGMIDAWHKYCQKQLRDSFQMLDEKLIFSNTETNKLDYASKRLPYPLEAGSTTAFAKLMSTLYTPEERHKIEWAIGAIVSGDSKKIQKFLVLYGEAGAGKSTVLNIIQWLFEGYYSVFDAKALGSSSNQFALEAFKKNPLVGIQHDGDLSGIQDNTRLNSLVSHEEMTVNEKHKGLYSNSFKCFLFMGTNKPVKITDAKSGLIRRLIDVTPSGNKLDPAEYDKVMKQIKFELGAIAQYCLDLYLSDPTYYNNYIPTAMLGASNDFYNFVIDSYHIFKKEDGTTLKAAWEMYKTYCEEAKVAYPFSQRVFKEELKNYFYEYAERFTLADGTRVRSYFNGFRTEKFETDTYTKPKEKEEQHTLIQFEEIPSIFDEERSDCFAQYATEKGTPLKSWDDNTIKLSELDTSKLHFVRVPENHIVIDFDIKGDDGKKSFEKNLAEASKWPATYAELSKSGGGIHLHYIYTGDVTKLSRIYDDNIEVKVFTGKSSLRRKLTKCNNLPIATISSGLPLKGVNKMVNFEAVKNEKHLRVMIKKNLNKEFHSSTRCSIDFIHKLLEDAYASDLCYDVSDMRNAVLAFAANSTNQADYCIKLVNRMHFKSEEPSAFVNNDNQPLVFYDVEVFPNLFLVNYKIQGEGKPVVRMINPKPSEIESLIKFRLVGFNCRRYDNHMLYARLVGYTNEQLYNLSQKIVNSKKGENRNCFFGEAYNLSYTDVYDFSNTKQSLKKWEIELGIHHQELGLPWDQPVPEEMWTQVAEYCDNDVIATEAVFNHLKADWTARQILADLAGASVNDTTNTLTARIIFGNNRKPQDSFNYRNLAEPRDDMPYFEGYTFDRGVSTYRGEEVGEGGYVYAEPGMYTNVALLDVASMHPASIIAENLFGPYTERFMELREARIAIKHGDYDAARKMLGGKLAKYLSDEYSPEDLAYAIKIPINMVYGQTAAKFENPFRDIRNIDNIVAKRGALFMVDLKYAVQEKGFKVAHIKTDSIKIPNATPEIIEFVMEFGKKYGYEFEHEATYERMCLVNNAVYIAKYKDGKKAGQWTATGAQFAVPYVFKKLFSKEEITIDDLCETKEVKNSAIYLNMNESLPDGEQDYRFIGRVGEFCPIKPGCGGGELVRDAKDKEGNIKYDAVTGTKGYRWMESEMVRKLNKADDIDRSYYDNLVNAAIYGDGKGKNRKPGIADFGDFEWFVSDYSVPELDVPPWLVACGKETCEGCPNFYYDHSHMECKLGYDIGDMFAMNTAFPWDNENDDFKKR